MKGPPDPPKPNLLTYEPSGGKLRLVAVEWLVPLTTDTKERPSLFGEKFLGRIEGHEPLIPKEFVHYDMHARLFKDNPHGTFAPTHPNVSCDGFDFALLEKPTKMMPGLPGRRPSTPSTMLSIGDHHRLSFPCSWLAAVSGFCGLIAYRK